MMMIANLIGFCVGLDGIIDLLKGILGSYYGTKLSLLGDHADGGCRIVVCGCGGGVVIYWHASHV
jgi:hypothetical protein